MSAPTTQITGSKALITVAVMLGALMSLIDISIVNVALSDIRASFGTPLDQIAWVSTGYMMANVVIIPLTGWFQQRFGFRKYFTGSIILFTIASALCGLAWNLPSLVAFRVLQGCGGGAIIPTAQAILFARYAKEERGMAGALFGLGAVTGPLLGPSIGGYLIDAVNWHWIFLINAPVGIFAAFLAWNVIEEPGFEKSRAPIDVPGILMLIVGMGSLQYSLEEGNRDGWLDSPLIAFLLVLAVTSLVTFVVHELETPNPVVNFRVFVNRSYTAATGLNFLLGTVLFGGSFMFSLFCGAVMHYTALDIGILFLRGSWIQLFLMPIIGRFGGKVDTRLLIGVGLVVNCMSLMLNAHLTQAADSDTLVAPLLVRAVGLSLVFVPLTVAAIADLPPRLIGGATGLFALTRELGGSIGTAWMSTSLDRAQHRYVTNLGAHVDLYNPIVTEQLTAMERGPMAGLADPHGAALQMLDFRIRSQALIRSFNDNYYALVVVFLMGFTLVAMLSRGKPGAAPVDAH